MMRYSIGDEDTELFSEHRTPGGAVKNVVTKAPRSASFQILPPKQAEVFWTPEECHNYAIFCQLHVIQDHSLQYKQAEVFANVFSFICLEKVDIVCRQLKVFEYCTQTLQAFNSHVRCTSDWVDVFLRPNNYTQSTCRHCALCIILWQLFVL